MGSFNANDIIAILEKKRNNVYNILGSPILSSDEKDNLLAWICTLEKNIEDSIRKQGIANLDDEINGYVNWTDNYILNLGKDPESIRKLKPKGNLDSILANYGSGESESVHESQQSQENNLSKRSRISLGRRIRRAFESPAVSYWRCKNPGCGYPAKNRGDSPPTRPCPICGKNEYESITPRESHGGLNELARAAGEIVGNISGKKRIDEYNEHLKSGYKNQEFADNLPNVPSRTEKMGKAVGYPLVKDFITTKFKSRWQSVTFDSENQYLRGEITKLTNTIRDEHKRGLYGHSDAPRQFWRKLDLAENYRRSRIYYNAKKLYDEVVEERRKYIYDHPEGALDIKDDAFIDGNKDIRDADKYISDLEKKHKFSSDRINNYDSEHKKLASLLEKAKDDIELRKELGESVRKDEVDYVLNLKKQLDDFESRKEAQSKELAKLSDDIKAANEDKSKILGEKSKEGDVKNYIHGLIKKGYGEDAAFNIAQRQFGLEEGEGSNKFKDFARLDNRRRRDEDTSTIRGKASHVLGGVADGFKIGANNEQKLSELSGRILEKQKLLDQLESDYEKTEDPYDKDVIDRQRQKVSTELEKLESEKELHETHRNRIGRAGAKLGGWISRRHDGYQNVKGAAGEKVTNGYRSVKAAISSYGQMVLAGIIFVALFYLTIGQPDWIPIDLVQMIIFGVLALLAFAVKSSLSGTEDGHSEAREIISILTVIFTLIAMGYGWWKMPNPWASIVFCFILAMYLFFLFWTDSLIFSIVMFFVMGFVVYMTMAGWTTEMGLAAEKAAQQTGFYDAISTTFDSIGKGWNDVSMMLFNPSEWYAKKEMEQNAVKDEGRSNRALEITKAEVKPNIATREGAETVTVDVIVDVENFGKETADKPARNAKIILSKDTKDKKYDNIVIDGKTGQSEVSNEIGNIISGTGAQEVFEVAHNAECVGMFTIKAKIKYDYSVDSTSNIFIIKADRYDELTSQDKFVPEKQVTKSTSGPISLSMRTNIDQPIPVQLPAGRVLKLHFGILNERSGGDGKVIMTNVLLDIPEEFTVMEGPECAFVKCSVATSNGKNTLYTLKDLHPTGVCAIVDLDNGLEITSDMKLKRCEIQFKMDKINEVYFSKPFNLLAHVDYNYEYSKDVSFTVRSGTTDSKNYIPQC